MIIPYRELSATALDSLIADYCTRYHGLNDMEEPLADNRARVLAALQAGQLVVLWSAAEQMAWIDVPEAMPQLPDPETGDNTNGAQP